MEKNAMVTDDIEEDPAKAKLIAQRLERMKDPRWHMDHIDSSGTDVVQMREAWQRNIIKDAIKSLQREQLADKKSV